MSAAEGSSLLQPAAPPFEPTWESLKTHQVPAWFEDAKLGIFIHWGLYSVPAFAPPSGELGQVDWNKWFYENAYAEWYLNTLRLKTTKTAEYHAKTYGADFDYYRFAETFNRESRKWNPGDWASLFKSVGAGYAVLTTKHHDGFTLWPSKVTNPKRAGLTATRDLVGDLTKAVRSAGLKMALYYSGGLDWTFDETPVAKMGDLRTTAPQSQEYANYADAHWRELIERYQPAILWNDITYPKAGKLREIFADYYNRFPDGLVNNRFGAEHFDFTTPEYSRYDKIVEKKWESCRGLGFSFGYNRQEGPEQVIASDKLIQLVADIVSKNGNLLLNIGPAPDGSISAIQQDRLKALGRWMAINGEAIHGTRPWLRPADKSGDSEIRYTRKGDVLYAIVSGRGEGQGIAIPGATADRAAVIEMLGRRGVLKWSQQPAQIQVAAPEGKPAYGAEAVKVTPAPKV
jgi:alpha-L-fucosidase